MASALRRSSAGALLATLLLLVVAVLPAAAAPPSDLTSASVSPTSGTTDTVIEFAVTYHNWRGTPPEYVRVVVGEQTFAMSKTAGAEDWKAGVRYTISSKLPVGTWTVRFEASNGRHASTLDGDGVTIVKAKPAPTPTPKPKPKPAPKPAPRLAPTPEPAPVRHHAKPRPKPAPRPTAEAPAPSAAPVLVVGALRELAEWPAEAAYPPGPIRSGDPATSGVLGAVGAAIGGGGGGGGNGGGGSGGGGTDGGDLPSGLGGPPSFLGLLAEAMPTVVVTTGGVTLAMAFMVFGKRRRDGLPTAPDDVLAANAALGSGFVPRGGLVPTAATVPGAAAATTAVQAAAIAVPAMVDEDAHLPRWRRPSLMEARKTDPTRTVSSSVKLTFGGEVSAAVTGMERRLIRYRLVGLLNAPDEIRGVEIGVLDEGDEVVLLERRGTYWRVLCPNGTEGWLHKMVLGDVVIDASTAPAGTWTAGDDGPLVGGFEDVLRAYTERRQQFGEA